MNNPGSLELMERRMKRSSIAAAGVIGTVVVGLAVAVSGWELNPTGDAEQLRSLLQVRRDTMHELVRTVDQHFRAGRVASDAVIQARGGLLTAELEMAATPEQRLAIHQRMIATMQDLERATAERYRMGTVTQAEVLHARAARLNAEIHLIRERNRTD
jgi:outer membrane protein TolC